MKFMYMHNLTHSHTTTCIPPYTHTHMYCPPHTHVLPHTHTWYLVWGVITGEHNRIELNFMLPGNTKFRPDSYFGLFKRHYRRQDHVNDMADLVDCVQLCGQNVACVPQLYQDWQYYNWNAYLGQ